MLRFLLLSLISFSLYAQQIALSDLAFLVQKKDGINIIFGKDVSKTLLVDFPTNYKKPSYLPYFKSVLSANDMTLRDDGGLYIVTLSAPPDNLSAPLLGDTSKPPLLPPPPLQQNNGFNSIPSPLNSENSINYDVDFSSYKLKFLQFNDVKSLLEFSNIPYSFSPVSKTLTFKQDKKNKKYLKKLIQEIKSIDILKEQVTLKVTMFSTNQDKLRQVGFNPSLSYDFSLLSQSGALLSGDAVGLFKSSLKFLSQNDVSDIQTSTAYLISDNDKLDFKKVISIPVLDENFALTTDNGTNQSKKFKYQDVGFKLIATPTIVGDVVFLDFSLTNGDILETGDLPITSENTIVNKFSVKKGDLIILAGLSKDTKNDDKTSIPFLEDIPFLGDIFTQKITTTKKETFNISIEILN
jgi:type II secretory pathway component GspD/PulD (secretin)